MQNIISKILDIRWYFAIEIIEKRSTHQIVNWVNKNIIDGNIPEIKLETKRQISQICRKEED